ncbi:hypothetical protein O9993_09650 [Vibrio lentus]|nr:hypothetical protein [Vibrio lentus]
MTSRIGPGRSNMRCCAGSVNQTICSVATVVKKFIEHRPAINAESVSPWGSYATFHCWNQSNRNTKLEISWLTVLLITRALWAQ